MKIAGLIISGILLLCGIIPLFYGVFNIGCVVLLLTAGALCYMSLAWRKHKRVFHTVATACLTASFLLAATVSGFMIRQAWFNSPPDGSNLPIIVLGGRVYEYGPSLMVAHRLNAAAEYLRSNPEAVCIVSGGQGTDEVLPEAAVMAQYLISKHKIDPARIIEEKESTSTLQNISYSRALIGDGDTVVIATDSFHQLRASILARKEGLTAYSVSCVTPPGLFPAYWVRDMLGVLATLATT